MNSKKLVLQLLTVLVMLPSLAMDSTSKNTPALPQNRLDQLPSELLLKIIQMSCYSAKTIDFYNPVDIPPTTRYIRNLSRVNKELHAFVNHETVSSLVMKDLEDRFNKDRDNKISARLARTLAIKGSQEWLTKRMIKPLASDQTENIIYTDPTITIFDGRHFNEPPNVVVTDIDDIPEAYCKLDYGSDATTTPDAGLFRALCDRGRSEPRVLATFGFDCDLNLLVYKLPPTPRCILFKDVIEEFKERWTLSEFRDEHDSPGNESEADWFLLKKYGSMWETMSFVDYIIAKFFPTEKIHFRHGNPFLTVNAATPYHPHRLYVKRDAETLDAVKTVLKLRLVTDTK